MLKLVYHTGVFGPIELEYDGPVVHVGRSEDNDLVLLHPSVEPHHCMLVFRGERLLCLPPDQAISSQTDLGSLAGPEFGAGAQITIGELQFSLAHSARSVAIPEVHHRDARAGVSEGDPASGASKGTGQRRYFCAHCRMFIPDVEVKRLGLVSHAKRYLCPKCSGLLDVEPKPPKPSPSLKGWLGRAVRKRT
ncbi:MAG TPA: FHA domain-containing protein, partial [Candidatus Methylomirabilis sp.]|nr:FHA domain-containing protein [Candidatus Methylomirabilis sp.]